MQLLCRIFLMLPIGITCADIKDYHRSTLNGNQFNDYAILYIERNTTEAIDDIFTIYYQTFFRKKARKSYKREFNV